MTDRKILEIQLDDSAFTDFKAKFDQYKAEVAKLPESWRHSGANISAQSANFAKMQASLRQQAERLASIGRGTLNTGKDVAIADLAWTRIFHSSKLFATNLHRSTMELARWTKLTAVFSGLLGAGGLFGITRMAQGVASRATSARGLGVTYGEKEAFDVAFGRLGNTDAILGGIAASQSDIRQQGALYSLFGSNAAAEKKKDAAQVFADALPLIKKLVNNTNPQNLTRVLEAYGLDKWGIGTEQARMIGGMEASEISEHRAERQSI